MNKQLSSEVKIHVLKHVKIEAGIRNLKSLHMVLLIRFTAGLLS